SPRRKSRVRSRLATAKPKPRSRPKPRPNASKTAAPRNFRGAFVLFRYSGLPVFRVLELNPPHRHCVDVTVMVLFLLGSAVLPQQKARINSFRRGPALCGRAKFGIVGRTAMLSYRVASVAAWKRGRHRWRPIRNSHGRRQPDKVVLSRDQLRLTGRAGLGGESTREHTSAPARQDERSEEKHSAEFAGRGSTADPGTPLAQGLYDPALDKDSCGVGFIADIKGRKSHQLIEDGLRILCNLEHRGAVGADPRMGDGAGILVQMPHKFFAKKTAELGIKLPKPGEYAVGYLFMPMDPNWRQIVRDIYAEVIAREGLTLLGWRDVPTDNSTLGESVKPTEPKHMQVL